MKTIPSGHCGGTDKHCSGGLPQKTASQYNLYEALRGRKSHDWKEQLTFLRKMGAFSDASFFLPAFEIFFFMATALTSMLFTMDGVEDT